MTAFAFGVTQLDPNVIESNRSENCKQFVGSVGGGASQPLIIRGNAIGSMDMTSKAKALFAFSSGQVWMEGNSIDFINPPIPILDGNNQAHLTAASNFWGLTGSATLDQIGYKSFASVTLLNDGWNLPDYSNGIKPDFGTTTAYAYYPNQMNAGAPVNFNYLRRAFGILTYRAAFRAALQSATARLS